MATNLKWSLILPGTPPGSTPLSKSQVASSVFHLFKPPTPPPHLCSQLMTLLPVSLRKQTSISQHHIQPLLASVHILYLWVPSSLTTQGHCPSKCPLSPAASLIVPTLLGSSHSCTRLLSFSHLKKTPLTLLHPQFSLYVSPPFAVSLLHPPIISRHSGVPTTPPKLLLPRTPPCSATKATHGPHPMALSAPFLSGFAWTGHSTLCF